MKRKKRSTPQKRYFGVVESKLRKYETELDTLAPMHFPQITKHKPNSKALFKSLFAIYCLDKGLYSFFMHDEYNRLMKGMVGRTGHSKPITADEVKRVVARRFTEKERYKIYSYLGHAFKYNTKATPPRSFSDCLFNVHTGFSWVIYYWLRPPGYDRVPRLDIRSIREEYFLAREIIGKSLEKKEKYYLKRNLLDLCKEFEALCEADIVPYNRYDSFEEFFQEFYTYLEETYGYGRPSIGYFKLNSLPYRKFILTLEDQEENDEDFYLLFSEE